MISIKTKAEIEIMREGGKRLARIMDEIIKEVKPGISTLYLDQLAERLISNNRGKSSFKGFQNGTGKKFPGVICASLNDEVVHGIPSSKKILREGDLLKIDIGMQYKGFHTDMARTVGVGETSQVAQRLARTAEEAFWKGVDCLKTGAKLSQYSKSVQSFVEKKGFSIVRDLVGHGIGREMHEDPQIPNYYQKGCPEIVLKEGITLALEPMINAGSWEVEVGEDGWVIYTKDRSLSAHYENTIVITQEGVEVLTK